MQAAGAGFWDLWWYHLPNYAAAVVMYTLLGRFVLGMFLPPDSPNYIFRFFCRLTNWAVAAVAVITPSVVPSGLLAPIAAFWLFALRIAATLAVAAAGMLPVLSPAAG